MLERMLKSVDEAINYCFTVQRYSKKYKLTISEEDAAEKRNKFKNAFASYRDNIESTESVLNLLLMLQNNFQDDKDAREAELNGYFRQIITKYQTELATAPSKLSSASMPTSSTSTGISIASEISSGVPVTIPAPSVINESLLQPKPLNTPMGISSSGNFNSFYRDAKQQISKPNYLGNFNTSHMTSQKSKGGYATSIAGRSVAMSGISVASSSASLALTGIHSAKSVTLKADDAKAHLEGIVGGRARLQLAIGFCNARIKNILNATSELTQDQKSLLACIEKMIAAILSRVEVSVNDIYQHFSESEKKTELSKKFFEDIVDYMQKNQVKGEQVSARLTSQNILIVKYVIHGNLVRIDGEAFKRRIEEVSSIKFGHFDEEANMSVAVLATHGK